MNSLIFADLRVMKVVFCLFLCLWLFPSFGESSLIRWSELDPISWLNLEEWKDDRLRRDSEPAWEKNIRERNSREVVGKVLDCVGVCRVYRGEGFFSSQFRTNLREGDEVYTIGDSYMWIFMMDGTLVRLSPDSSISFKEFNIGSTENFLHARLNFGNILWMAREEALIKENSLRETDTLFLPLAYFDANPTHEEFEKVEENNLFEWLEKVPSSQKQQKRLNKLIEKNNKVSSQKPTYSFLIMPNGTLQGYQISAEFIVGLGGKSYFKKRSFEQMGLKGEGSGNGVFSFRGLENNRQEEVDVGGWYEVGEKGRSLSTLKNSLRFHAGEYLSKRIYSILVARELLFHQHSQFIFNNQLNHEKISLKGYRKWGSLKVAKDDLAKRLNFLNEYTRRVETTALLTAERFKKKLQERGEKVDKFEYSDRFYRRAITHYTQQRLLDIEFEGEREVLNSTKKKFWRVIHGRRK